MVTPGNRQRGRKRGKFYGKRRQVAARVQSEQTPMAPLPVPPVKDMAEPTQEASGTRSAHAASLASSAAEQGQSSRSEANRDYIAISLRDHLAMDVAGVVDQAQPRHPKRSSRAANLTRAIAEYVAAWREERRVPGASDDVYLRLAYEQFMMARYWIEGKQARKEPQMYPRISAFIRMVAHFVKHDAEEYGGVCGLVLPFRATNSVPSDSAVQGRADVGLGIGTTEADVNSLEDLSYSKVFAVLQAKRTGSDDSLRDLKRQASSELFSCSRQLFLNQADRRFVWGLTCVDTSVYACLFGNYKAYESPAMDIKSGDGCKEFIRLLVGWSLCSWHQLGYDKTISWDEEHRCYLIEVPSATPGQMPTIYYSDTVISKAQRLFGRHCRCFLATSQAPPTGRPEGSQIKPNVAIKDSWTMCTAPEGETAGVEAGIKDAQLGSASPADSAVDLETGRAGGQLVDGWPVPDFDPDSAEGYRCLPSEYALLKKITGEFDGDAGLTGTYSKLEHGGWVYQPLDADELGPDSASGNGKAATDMICSGRVLDSTRDILGQLDSRQLDHTPFSVHTRIASSPIGESIGTLDSVGELICALYDVMKCYMEMFQRCDIVHRDISYNNILVVRDEEGQGRPRGLLIDFDCARDLSVESHTSRPEQVGSFSFMSVANLEKLDVQRTILDDWESLLYLVCVIGTHGLKVECEEIEGKRPMIYYWYDDTAQDAAMQKRNHMAHTDLLHYSILQHFDQVLDKPNDGDELGPLATLASELHLCLFENKRWRSQEDRRLYHGALRVKGSPDPFVERAKYERAFWMKKQHRQSDDDSLPAIPDHHGESIGEELLEILRRAAGA